MKERIAHAIALEFNYLEFGDSIQVFDDYIYIEISGWRGDVKVRLNFDYNFFVEYKLDFAAKMEILIKDIYRHLTARAYADNYEFETKSSF